MTDRELKRYSAYFRGWCQAFGEHEGIHPEDSGVNWLLAEHQIGLVLPRQMIRPLYREVLLHRKPPALEFSRHGVRIGSVQIDYQSDRERRVREAVRELASSEADTHVFLTSHLLYGGGNRIITFSSRKPLAIIYKEIGGMPIHIRF
jgi:hypothetical protein